MASQNSGPRSAIDDAFGELFESTTSAATNVIQSMHQVKANHEEDDFG